MRSVVIVLVFLVSACGRSERHANDPPRERTTPHVTLLDKGTYHAAADGMLGVVVASYSDGKMEVTRLASSGNVAWSLAPAAEFDQASLNGPSLGGIVVDAQGNSYVTGGFVGELSIGGQSVASAVNPGSSAEVFDPHGQKSSDAFVLKLNRAGGVEWLKSFGGVGDQWGLGIGLAPDGTLGLAVAFSGRIDLGPATYLSSGGATVSDLLLVRLDTEGNPHAARSFALEAMSLSTACFDRDGAFLIGAPAPYGGAETELGKLPDAGWVAKFDANFAPRWLVSTDDELGPDLTGLATDSEGNVFLSMMASGSTRQFGEETGKRALGFAKLDPDGGLVFSHSIGGNTLDYASDVAVLSDDTFVIAGSHHDVLDFGEGTVLPLNESGLHGAMFAARFDPDGNLLSVLDMASPDDDYPSALVPLPDDTLVLTGSTTQGPGLPGVPRQGTGFSFVAWLGTLL